MLNIKNAIEKADKEEITIFYGPIKINNKIKDIAITYKKENDILNLYEYIDPNTPTEDISIIPKSEENISRFILTRLLTVYRHIVEIKDKINHKNKINLPIPNKYILVASHSFKDTLPIIDEYSRMFNTSTVTAIKTIEDNHDNLTGLIFSTIDDNPCILYPETLIINNIPIKTNNDNGIKSINKFSEIATPSIILSNVITHSKRYSFNRNGYIINMRTNNLTHDYVITVIDKNEHIFTIKPNLMIIAFYMVFQDPNYISAIEAKLFDLIINNLIEVNDNNYNSIKYNQLIKNYYQYININNINFVTVCDITCSAIYDSAKIIKDLNMKNYKIFQDNILKNTLLLNMFKYLIKNVNSIQDISQPPTFKIVK